VIIAVLIKFLFLILLSFVGIQIWIEIIYKLRKHILGDKV